MTAVDASEAQALEFLGELERREAELLSWGVVEGAFSEDELFELASQFLWTRTSEFTAEELIDELHRRRLLFRVSASGRPQHRTRMAETIRLLARLRQILPWNTWKSAPTLVADFRFALRPRAYPRRDQPAAEVRDRLASTVDLAPLERVTLEAVLGLGRDTPANLARFQARAAEQMLCDLSTGQTRGMIVAAGTGTGKTLSFYLPALSHVASLIERREYWTKAIALYPRNELLKDQFSDTYAEARKLDGVLQAAGLRKLAIGAYFGLTPRNGWGVANYAKWKKVGGDYACPYLRCPRCEGILVWRKADLDRRRERLECITRGCGAAAEEDEVMLTRERMEKTPPDVLFTTTEMVNRRITDTASRHLFGVRAKRPPRILLLDEVHTYSGTHGAHVALLLRRWRHALGEVPLHYTGLSATLRNGTEFFSTLVGLPTSAVEMIAPAEDDMVREGMEYQLAVRGDPGSGASLLATTIQTTMLLRRALDTSMQGPSGGASGSKVFVFTDDLDVTNRLFHDLLDAEGRWGNGNPKPGKAPLAAFRARTQPDNAERMMAGQSWALAEEIGHPEGLGIGLIVDRTTSQDTGVAQEADVVVATASLEVGYNDPGVGVVIQHKAPRDVASFLQRKGRAGRRRITRPWTVVVLSDYGRDRIAYQAYDSLFDPVLEARSLPVGNRYVLRMQAVFAFLDWLSGVIAHDLPEGSVWDDASGPPLSKRAAEAAKIRTRQEAEAEVIRKILGGSGPDLLRSLEIHLSRALSVDEDEVQALLWEPPRALMTAVLPTLLRRLESVWYRLPTLPGETEQDHTAPFSPLPEFVPLNLFSDLNLPEVTILTPAEFRGGEPRTDSMSLVPALRAYAPGRVSRRFGIESARTSHWIAPPRLVPGRQTMTVDQVCSEYEAIGSGRIARPNGDVEVPCYRPWRIEPTQIPESVRPTSNAFLFWRSQLLPSEAGVSFTVPSGTGWGEVVHEVLFYAHNRRTHVEVRRMALGSQATIALPRGKEVATTVDFTGPGGDGPAALGFVQEVDGVVFRYQIPDVFTIDPEDPNQAKVWAFRTSYFRMRVLGDPFLSERTNSFRREWLVQIYLSALVTRAMREGSDLPSANQLLRTEGLSRSLEEVLSILFQSLPPDGEPDESGAEDEEGESAVSSEPQKVHKALAELCADAAVTERLAVLAAVLWNAPDAGWHAWARDRFRATLGGALLEACQRICPDARSGDLILDLGGGPRDPGAPPLPDGVEEIWITEATIGGGGIIEDLLREYAGDPRRFYQLATSALAPSDFEVVDAELTRLVREAQAEEAVADAIASVRGAEDHAGLQAAIGRLRRTLSQRGYCVTHAVLAALSARVLRPGTSPASDRLLARLLGQWDAKEADLRIQIDARVFACLASMDPELDEALQHIPAAQRSDPQWRFQTAYGLLWPRAGTLRGQSLTSYNPFATAAEPDREILLHVLEAGTPEVHVAADGWQASAADALAERGAVRLWAERSCAETLRSALLELTAEPLEVGFLHLYPRCEAAQQGPERLAVTLVLPEAVL